ncbi:MAG: zinc ABC transporter substrate-binding protein [Alphaproteobacteria bacterium]|nr:zinc ABC transporter substrate-binding protein [Alphaproteobacteria bacterium]
MRRLLICLVVFLASVGSAQAQVVVSIKPLHSLAAGVMQGSGIEPSLLVAGSTSLHDFTLKPSQAGLLHHADIILYMGDDFELFLTKILPQLPASTRRVAMEKVPGITFYPVRSGGDTEGHGHEDDAHDHDEHDHGNQDLHLWLSPQNARAMVAEIARVLVAKYPEHAALFARNAVALDAKLQALDAQLRERMALLSGKPFAVFHDATQYFDRAYGLDFIGAVALHEGHAPGAKHLQELRARIAGLHAACVFSEPEFDGRVIDNLMRGTGAKSAVIDPEAALIAPGPDLYFQLMEGIAAGMETCLK